MNSLDHIDKQTFQKLCAITTDVAGVGYWQWDIKTNNVHWSRKKVEIYGEDTEGFEPSFEKFLAMIDEETKALVLEEIDHVLTGRKPYYDLQHKIYLKNGKTVWIHEKAFVRYDTDGTPLHLIGIVYDITEKMLLLDDLKHSTDHRKYLETHDPLTGALNKDALISQLSLAEKEVEDFSLIFIDIDNFTEINNTYGYLSGDTVLRHIAESIKHFHGSSSYFRYSSDEFALIVQGETDIQAFLETLQTYLGQPLRINGEMIDISVTLGAASYPRHASSAHDLIKHAHTALQLAKLTPQRQLVYQPHMADLLREQRLLFDALVTAIKQEEFTPFFQPQINAKTNEIVGFEALARWKREGEYILPESFLPLAAEKNILSEIDYIILKKSLYQLALWHREGHEITLSVNFVSNDFSQEKTHHILLEYQDLLPYLTIEITENTIFRLSKEAQERLDLWKSMGIRLSLDDFGTGYSSLLHIQQFPLDELKIDKTFVDDIPGSEKNKDLVRIIKSIIDTFHFHCVVEGVENEAQRSFFLDLGIDTIQGYIYAQPLSPKKALNFLKRSVSTYDME